jgi:hypothetical protein
MSGLMSKIRKRGAPAHTAPDLDSTKPRRSRDFPPEEPLRIGSEWKWNLNQAEHSESFLPGFVIDTS